jgi:Ca2+-binding EF-hand superfamily protein
MVDGDAGAEAQRRQGLVAELISKLADLAGLDQLRSKLFDELDTDGNGVLDLQEFRAGLVQFGMEVSENDAKLLMSFIDTDGNGVLDEEEFKRGAPLSVSSCGSAAGTLELELDKHIKKLLARLMSELSDPAGLALLRSKFDELDADGSGVLDLQEFHAGLLSFGMEVSENDAKSLLSVFDPDGDGELSCEVRSTRKSRECSTKQAVRSSTRSLPRDK